MADTVNFSVRMDKDVKQECEAIYNELGMTLTTAINVFLRQSIREHGLPFEARLREPSRETVEAMLEVQQMKADPTLGKTYTDVDRMMEELLADV